MIEETYKKAQLCSKRNVFLIREQFTPLFGLKTVAFLGTFELFSLSLNTRNITFTFVVFSRWPRSVHWREGYDLLMEIKLYTLISKAMYDWPDDVILLEFSHTTIGACESKCLTSRKLFNGWKYFCHLQLTLFFDIRCTCKHTDIYCMNRNGPMDYTEVQYTPHVGWDYKLNRPVKIYWYSDAFTQSLTDL